MKDKKFMFTSLMVMFIAVCNISKAIDLDANTINFNKSWKFKLGDLQNAQLPEFNDSDWRDLNLPHDWSVEGKFSQEWASGTAYLPTGIGWYRKTFKVEKSAAPSNLYIYFDGVMRYSEVWINGHSLGKRPNGFIAFYYDLTDFVKAGENNVIAVRVDHSSFADSRFYLGSGINRNVYLIKKDPLHIDIWGVKYTTELASDNKSAQAKVVVDVLNNRSSKEDITIATQLVDENGKTVAQSEKNISIGKGEKSKNELSFQIKDPLLWSVEKPNLYKLNVRLVKNKKELDSQVTPVGFRSIRFDANKGFFLNGVNMKMKGVCIHDDGGGVFGTAVPPEVWARRLKTFKAGGANAIRMAHNPHADYLYDLCDEIGLMVMDEAYDEWEYGKNKWIQGRNVGEPGHDGTNKFFKEWAERDVKTFVLRNQNHPSIILWSIGNELEYPNDPYTSLALNEGNNPQSPRSGFIPELPNISELPPVAEKLVKWVKEIDQSIPVTAALAGVTMSNTTNYPQLLDVVGYNYYERSYVEDHKKYPQRIIYGSENGKGLTTWEAVKNNDYISGIYLWTGVDFLGEANTWPSNHSNAGILDLAGDPKPDYYFQKSLWDNEPMVFIGTSRIVAQNRGNTQNRGPARFTPEQHYNYKTGDTVRVSAYTTCEEVELFLNGKSLGRQKISAAPTKVINWVFPYEAGTIVAKAYNKENEICNCQLQTVGEPASFRATFDKSSLKKEEDLAHLKIEIVDKAGNPVKNASNVITVKVTGAGQLRGIESGEIVDGDVNLQSDTRLSHMGKLLAFIQPVQKKGDVTVTISSPGLESKTVTITAK
ncbi:MAG TPA: sugar-binding domain-containing protein [Bacteroidales bacterium]